MLHPTVIVEHGGQHTAEVARVVRTGHDGFVVRHAASIACHGGNASGACRHRLRGNSCARAVLRIGAADEPAAKGVVGHLGRIDVFVHARRGENRELGGQPVQHPLVELLEAGQFGGARQHALLECERQPAQLGVELKELERPRFQQFLGFPTRPFFPLEPTLQPRNAIHGGVAGMHGRIVGGFGREMVVGHVGKYRHELVVSKANGWPPACAAGQWALRGSVHKGAHARVSLFARRQRTERGLLAPHPFAER